MLVKECNTYLCVVFCLSTEMSGLTPEEQIMHICECGYLPFHMGLYNRDVNIYACVSKHICKYVHVYKGKNTQTQAYITCSFRSQSSVYEYGHIHVSL